MGKEWAARPLALWEANTPEAFVEPPFNYTGSKYKLLPQIVPLLKKRASKGAGEAFIDLFAGGGSVYANMAPYFRRIVVNDALAPLVEMHRAIHDPEFAQTVRMACVDKDDQEGYNMLRAAYNAKPSAVHLYALMLCCTNNMARFNQKGQFNQTFGRRSFSEATAAKIKRFCAALAPHQHKLNYSSLSFEKVAYGVGNLIYADPPYDNTEAGYNAWWTKRSTSKLRDYLLEAVGHGADCALSYAWLKENGLPDFVYELQDMGFTTHHLHHNYNKVSRKGQKEYVEVLLTSY